MDIRGNRGQFYLMATIIIIGIVISIITITNYSLKKNYIDVYDYAAELQIEGEKVIDYQTTTSDNVFDDFAENYSKYAGNSKEIYFIVGKRGALDVFRYNGESKEAKVYAMDGTNITMDLYGHTYNLETKEGENFQFIIIENRGGEQYVITS
jgi:hypothetical protein